MDDVVEHSLEPLFHVYPQFLIHCIIHFYILGLDKLVTTLPTKNVGKYCFTVLFDFFGLELAIYLFVSEKGREDIIEIPQDYKHLQFSKTPKFL